MTANQIARADVTEGIRHNQAVESETNRHNVAMEQLEDRKTAVLEQRNQWEATYRAEDLRLKELLTNKDLEIKANQGEIKLQLQREYQELLDQYYANQDDWHRKENELKQIENDIKSDTLMATAAHNTALEGIERTRTENERQLREKSLEYQKYQWDTENTIKLTSVQNDLTANYIKFGQLKEQIREYDKNYGLKEAETVTSGIGDVTKAIKNTMDSVGTILKFGSR